jgi:Pyruvate/2-oxoacid:ferredoxin oxidoreductase delta subunit
MASKRQVIRIDEALCDGCGQCASACAEGAIRMIDGKARLVSDSYCDGLGACLGECPQGAITLEEREAEPFDEAAVHAHLARMQAQGNEMASADATAANATEPDCPGGGCAGSAMQDFRALVAGMRPGAAGRGTGAPRTPTPGNAIRAAGTTADPSGGARGHGQGVTPVPESAAAPSAGGRPTSRLGHWPVQLGLVPPTAPFLNGADLLICADCVPFVVPDFHARDLAGRSVVVACPKLDDMGPHRERLAGILAQGRPARVTVLRMEVPCCGGLGRAVLEARDNHAPHVPVEIHTWGVRDGVTVQAFPPVG